ncbi:MAG TPA: hypothetical protein VFG21_06885 [Xanthomonadaceae bacterium]|nr:hypothetical protein [Xanthomonadaceae bacterium]
MSNASSARIELHYRPSGLLALAVSALALAAAACVWVSVLPAWAALAVVPLWAWALADLRAGQGTRIVLGGDGVATLARSSREWRAESVAIVEAGPLTVLELSGESARTRLLFCGDTLAPALRRQLRLWVRAHQARAAAEAARP